jgi:hypothetical protein
LSFSISCTLHKFHVIQESQKDPWTLKTKRLKSIFFYCLGRKTFCWHRTSSSVFSYSHIYIIDRYIILFFHHPTSLHSHAIVQKFIYGNMLCLTLHEIIFFFSTAFFQFLFLFTVHTEKVGWMVYCLNADIFGFNVCDLNIIIVFCSCHLLLS